MKKSQKFESESEFNFKGCLSIKHPCRKKHNPAECSKSSPNRRKMASRVLTYKGKNMHICSECKKSFDRAGNLKMHMLIHSKKRAYTCVQCEKSFVQAGNLKTHMLTHSGDPHLLGMWRFIW